MKTNMVLTREQCYKDGADVGGPMHIPMHIDCETKYYHHAAIGLCGYTRPNMLLPYNSKRLNKNL